MKHRTQVRHLLHAADFGRQQRLLSLVKLLGELYNDLVTHTRARTKILTRARTHTHGSDKLLEELCSLFEL